MEERPRPAVLGENLTELIALRVSCLMENAYERVQHERRCLKVGLGKAWVRAVKSLGTSGDEAFVARYVACADP